MLNKIFKRLSTLKSRQYDVAGVQDHSCSGQAEFERFASKIVSIAQRNHDCNSHQGLIFNVTSIKPEEGKSFICEKLAKSIVTISELRVMLIDASFTHPVLESKLKIAECGKSAGHINADNHAALEVYETAYPNLSFCPLSSDPRNKQLFNPATILNLYDYLRENYDVVIVDNESVKKGGLNMLLSVADHVLLVVDSETSKREMIRSHLDEMDSVKEKILGVVLNKKRYYIPERLYEKL